MLGSQSISRSIEENAAKKHRELNKKREEQLYIVRKIAQVNPDLERLVVEMGGQCAEILDSDVTHVIFQGKNRVSSKEFRLAREMNKIIVSTEWIYICKSEGRRVDEDAFPHTYNPKTSLTMSESQAFSGRAVSKRLV